MSPIIVLFPLACVVSFLFGAFAFYGIGRISGIEDALIELKLHRKQHRLEAKIASAAQPIDTACTFCQFVEAEHACDDPLYLKHLAVAHGMVP